MKWPRWKHPDAPDTGMALGFLGAVYGVWLVSEPVAWMLGGVGLMVGSYLIGRGR